MFNSSLAQGIFSEEMKIARITRIYKGGDKEYVVSNRPISILPCLYQKELCITDCNKQSALQKRHSTDHVIVQFADQIHDMFNKSIYTLGIFMDVPKAFDTVNHKILLKKLPHYGIKNKSLDWFTWYLSNGKEFIGGVGHIQYLFCGTPEKKKVKNLQPLASKVIILRLRHHQDS